MDKMKALKLIELIVTRTRALQEVVRQVRLTGDERDSFDDLRGIEYDCDDLRREVEKLGS